jgi:hypothetical protein
MAYRSGCAGRTLLRRYDSLDQIRLRADMFMGDDVVMKAVAMEIMADPRGGLFTTQMKAASGQMLGTHAWRRVSNNVDILQHKYQHFAVQQICGSG